MADRRESLQENKMVWDVVNVTCQRREVVRKRRIICKTKVRDEIYCSSIVTNTVTEEMTSSSS